MFTGDGFSLNSGFTKIWCTLEKPLPISRCMKTLLGLPYWLKTFLWSIVSYYSNVSRYFLVRLIQLSVLLKSDPYNILSRIIFAALNLCLQYGLSESVVVILFTIPTALFVLSFRFFWFFISSDNISRAISFHELVSWFLLPHKYLQVCQNLQYVNIFTSAKCSILYVVANFYIKVFLFVSQRHFGIYIKVWFVANKTHFFILLVKDFLYTGES